MKEDPQVWPPFGSKHNVLLCELGAPMRVLSLQGDLVDSPIPAQHRARALPGQGSWPAWRIRFFSKLLKAKREGKCPARRRGKTLAAQDGKCARAAAGEAASWTSAGEAFATETLRERSPRVWRAVWPRRTGVFLRSCADGVEPVDGVLPDLGFVEGARGATWRRRLRRALERMDAAWPEGEEHMAKLSVNVVYSVRSSNSKLDGADADFFQAFAYKGGMVWDFVYARRLLSNGTYRPIHNVVLDFKHCMVATAPGRAAALFGAGEDGLPADAAAAEALRGASAGAGGAVPPGRHAGLPRGRDEAVAGQPGAARGGGAPQTTEVERGGPYKPLPGGQLPAAHGPAGHRKDVLALARLRDPSSWKLPGSAPPRPSCTPARPDGSPLWT